MKDYQLNVRISAAKKSDLDRICSIYGLSQSDCIERLIQLAIYGNNIKEFVDHDKFISDFVDFFMIP